jgi:hypothetical protein
MTPSPSFQPSDLDIDCASPTSSPALGGLPTHPPNANVEMTRSVAAHTARIIVFIGPPRASGIDASIVAT